MLVRTVIRLQKSNLLKRHVLHDQTATIRLLGKHIGFSIVAVGPEYAQLATAGDAALAGISDASLSVNECSVVLVVQLVTEIVSRRIFLPGDMEGDGMKKSLTRWDSHPDNVDGNRTFDVVKAPHHGSINGHDLALADRIARQDESVLMVSCGNSYGLPSRRVLSDYLDRGWRVYCTSPRQSVVRRMSALQATQQRNRLHQLPVAIGTYDLAVTVGRIAGIKTTPATARIERHHVNAYQ